MRLYQINGKGYAVDGDQLFELTHVPALGPTPAPEEEAEPERVPEPTSIKKIHLTPGRKPRLGDEARAAIIEELRAGAKQKDLAEKYGVSVPTIANIGRGGSVPSTRPSARVNAFQCMKGHRFQTTLPQKDAICPTCRSKVFRKVDEQPVTEEAA